MKKVVSVTKRLGLTGHEMADCVLECGHGVSVVLCRRGQWKLKPPPKRLKCRTCEKEGAT